MKPTLKQKVEQYEQLLHNINMMLVCNNNEGVKKYLHNIDKWSYMHRVGNGTLSEKEQQELIDRAFWRLNET